MTKKKNDIENLDEQIEKLKNERKLESEINGKEKKESKKTEVVGGTKEFKKIEDTDTKVFDASEVNDSVSEEKEDTKVGKVLESSDNKNDENVLIECSEEHEMSDTFIDEKPKKTTGKRVLKKQVKIIIVLSVILVVLIGLIIGVIISKKNDDNDKDNKIVEKVLSESDKESIINKYGTDLEKVIGEELITNNKLLLYEEALKLVKTEEKINCKIHEIYEDGKIYLNKCSINGVLTKYSYGVEQEIIDNSINVYVEKSSGKATLTKPSVTDEPLYENYKVDCGDVYSNVYLLNDMMDYIVYFDSEGLVKIKNYKTDEKILNNLDYKEVVPIKNGDDYDTTNVAVLIGNFWGIYKYTGEQIISPMYSDFVSDLNNKTDKRSSINVLASNLIIAYDSKNYGVIDYTSNKNIVPFEFSQLTVSENYIIATEKNGKNKLYDFNGKEYFSYDVLYGKIDREYFLVKQDDSVNIVQLDGKKLYEYGIINNMGEFHLGKVNDQKVTFQLLDLNSTDKCINIMYDISEKSGTYTTDNMCD